MTTYSLKILIVCCVMAAAVGCKRRTEQFAPPRPTRPIVQLRALTQLPPNQTVHVAVDVLGNVYYTVETDRGNDGVLIVGGDGLPRATQLTSANILAAAGETIGGSGTIQSLAPGTDGAVYFYFVGGKGRQIRAMIGRFNPRGEVVQILFDTQTLRRESQMGDSIELARGELFTIGRRIGMLLRHSDRSITFAFDTSARASGAPVLSRLYDSIRLEDQPIDLTKTRYELTSGTNANSLLVDKNIGAIYDVSETGTATLRVLLAGLPREMSEPRVVDDRLLIFVAASDPIESDVTDPLAARLPQVSYPALLQIAGHNITAIGRDDFRSSGGFPAYAVRIHHLHAAPDGSFVGYDLASGLLLRINLAQE